jgi:ketosteroid isomerase-like protein
MEKAEVARWLDRYVAAWKSYDREQILDLFSERAVYRYRPDDEPIVGSSAIADDWIGDPDDPGSYDASYQSVAVDGDTAVVTGSSTYTDPDGSLRTIFDNCFVIRFDSEGRCTEFTEWFMERPAPAGA